MSKRKRSQTDEAAAGAEDGPRKTRVLDAQDAPEEDDQARAAARQAKSERRSKKKDSTSKPAKHTKTVPKATESLIPDQLPPTNTDQFSSNNDFVSLDSEATKADSKNPKTLKKAASMKKSSSQTASKDAQTPQPHRFILFIGNLPFSTTSEAITHHFRALQPFTVRHRTDKKTKKSLGTAFIEFESYDKMKTCLKLYHHSLFDPDAHLTTNTSPEADTPADKAQQRGNKKTPTTTAQPDQPSSPPPPKKDTRPQWQKHAADKTRRINVELTAGGGGGKSAGRRAKIQTKNAKLAEERERFQKREAEEREKKRFDGGGKERGGKGTGANATDDLLGEDGGRGHVHPSRLRRVKG